MEYWSFLFNSVAVVFFTSASDYFSTPFLLHFRMDLHRDMWTYNLVGCAKKHAVSSFIGFLWRNKEI